MRLCKFWTRSCFTRKECTPLSPRGTAFSFVAKITSSVSASVVNDCWKRDERYVVLDASLIGRLRTPVGEPYAVQHIEHFVRSICTTCTLEDERRAPRNRLK